jgi:hypothetical protein
MTKWDWFQVLTGAASVGGVVMTAGALLAGWLWTKSTNRLISQGDQHTQALVAAGDQHTQALVAAGDQHTQTILGRMNELAEERHRALLDKLPGEEAP